MVGWILAFTCLLRWAEMPRNSGTGVHEAWKSEAQCSYLCVLERTQGSIQGQLKGIRENIDRVQQGAELCPGNGGVHRTPVPEKREEAPLLDQ